MVLFLLKSSACLAIFLMFYKLLLEKERMHIFKRYYLLAALVLSLVIPSITFTEYTEVGPIPSSSEPAPDAVPTESELIGTTAKESVEPAADKSLMPTYNQSQRAVAEPAAKDYWSTLTVYGPLVLWTIYGLGVILFSLKFLVNLSKLVCNVRNHPKIQIGRIVQVLLKDNLVPHTFWKYLFLNQQKFEANEIPREVLLHEATHARQRHSVDVLFVELLQIVFWFNPLFHFTKKAIKLNHEFLADAAVLDQGACTPDYQNKILAFASSAEYKKYQPAMANAIHYSSYSSIKKRFTVMKTQTSKKSILIRCLMIMPLLTFVLYGFSTTVQIPKPMNDFAKPSEENNSFQEGATEKQMAEYNALAQEYNEMLSSNGSIRIKRSDINRMEYLLGLMSEEQRAMMQEQKAEMRRQANGDKVQGEKRKEQQVQMQEQVAQMEAQREKMTQREKMKEQQKVMEEQRSKIEEERMLMKEHQTEIEKQKALGLEEAKIEENVLREIIEKQEIIAEEHPLETSPFWYLNEEGETKIYLEGKEISYAKMNKMEQDGMITSMNIIKKPNGNSLIKLNERGFRAQTPPVPPKPKPPLELLEELKKDDVKIILNGKEITYEKAEKVLEEGKIIQVRVNRENGERPVMKLTSQ